MRSSAAHRLDSAGQPACCCCRCRSGADRSRRSLLFALLTTLRYGGPLLAISGEQGSAKTVLSKILRALIDPNAAPVRSAPREERNLFIAAGNGHLLAFDNLSDIPDWISDALCRLASGGSFAVRQLYSDRDEVLLQAARPIILNGIEAHHPAGSGGPCDLSHFAALGGRTSTRRERDLARFQKVAAAHPRSVVRRCKPRLACAARGSTGTAAADGRLCSLGDRLRTSFLSRWGLSARV
jgi:hypothetical protein